MDISQETLKKIEEKNISPHPRWKFLVKDALLWISFSSFVFFGSLAMSAILFMLVSQDWDIYNYLHRTLAQHIAISMPYLWLSLLIIFIIVAYYNFKYTKIGYKYEIRNVIFVSIFLSIIIGSILFGLGLGSKIHRLFFLEVPGYNQLIFSKEDVWMNPQDGLLGGKIITIENSHDFILSDENGRNWEVEILSPNCCNPVLLRPGSQVEMIGQEASGTLLFIVNSMRPWRHFGR
jgi:hypothetical protein